VGKGEMGINRPQHVRQIRGCFAHSAWIRGENLATRDVTFGPLYRPT
jgi:hypothetical protein